MLSLAANETGYDAFEQALNTSRTQTQLTAPAVDDGRINMSNGQVAGSSTYNDRFRGGEPYTIEFLSSTEYKITDAEGNDVTLEASGEVSLTLMPRVPASASAALICAWISPTRMATRVTKMPQLQAISSP